jgi:hypothetical protein
MEEKENVVEHEARCNLVVSTSSRGICSRCQHQASLKLMAHRGRDQSIRWAVNLTFARGTCQEATLVQERGFSERWLVT